MHVLQCLRTTNRSVCAWVGALALSISACGGTDDDTSDEGSGGQTGSGGEGSGGDASAGGTETGGAASAGGSGSGGEPEGAGGSPDATIGACDQACSAFPCTENYNGCSDDEACRNCMHFGEGCDALSEQRLSLLQLACDCREPTGCELQCPHEAFCAHVDSN